MKRGLFFCIALCLFMSLCFSISFAQVEIPQELVKFYSNDASTLTLSNNSLLLYSDFDREIIYYLYYNGINTTLNLTIEINCTSNNCPDSSQLLLDYMKDDVTLPFVKKAAGIFVLTNNSKLGEFDYDLVVFDINANYSQKAPFRVTVISSSLWTQFWHNLLNIFG